MHISPATAKDGEKPSNVQPRGAGNQDDKRIRKTVTLFLGNMICLTMKNVIEEYYMKETHLFQKLQLIKLVTTVLLICRPEVEHFSLLDEEIELSDITQYD